MLLAAVGIPLRSGRSALSPDSVMLVGRRLLQAARGALDVPLPLPGQVCNAIRPRIPRVRIYIVVTR